AVTAKIGEVSPPAKFPKNRNAPRDIRELKGFPAVSDLFGGDEAGFGRLQPFEKCVRQHQPPFTRGVGHGAARRRQLLARPAAKKACVGLHLPLHDLLTSESQTAVYSDLSTGRVRFGDGTKSQSAPPRQRTPRSVAVPPSESVATKRVNSAPRGSRSPSVASLRMARATMRRTISAGTLEWR